MVAIAAGIGMLLQADLSPASIPLLLLLAVLVASLRFGFWTGIYASVLAFLVENFFFIEPRFTFHVAHPADWLSLAVLLVAGATIGLLVGRLSEEAEAARIRAFVLEVTGQSASDLADIAAEPDVLQGLVRHLARLDGGAAIVLVARDTRFVAAASQPPQLVLDPMDSAAAERCLRRSEATEPAAPGWMGGRLAFRPLRGVGIVGHTLAETGGAGGQQIAAARTILIEQATLALDRLRLARDAAEARQSAERESLRSALLSSLSHDLKTPRATILGGVSALRELGDAMPEKARIDTLQAVEEEAGRLTRYVADLLHMTRLKAGIELRTDWIDPADVARAAVTRARRAWPDRLLILEVPPGLPIVRSDAVLLEQALFNLIDNACKFSSVPNPVTMSITTEGEALVMTVRDRGAGIPPGDQARVFEAFFRGDSGEQAGAGLGLAIVRGIVQALGGTIRVESPCDGNTGTAMHIRLERERGA
jgi:two-component system sensor histidine kinase KdpD